MRSVLGLILSLSVSSAIAGDGPVPTNYTFVARDVRVGVASPVFADEPRPYLLLCDPDVTAEVLSAAKVSDAVSGWWHVAYGADRPTGDPERDFRRLRTVYEAGVERGFSPCAFKTLAVTPAGKALEQRFLSVPRRPKPERRSFRSRAVDAKVAEVTAALRSSGRDKLALMFENCYPNTLDTTVRYRKGPDGDDETFVLTGDIPAMWLRDSAAQVWPYLRLMKDDDGLRRMIRGVVLKQFELIRLDPYANAFNDLPSAEAAQPGRMKAGVQVKKGVWERKYELDSLCYPIRLAHGYWKASGDGSVFDARWLKTLRTILAVMREQQHKDSWKSGYYFACPAVCNNAIENGGWGRQVKPVGLIASSFRPSDDATQLPFLVPSNLMAADVLGKAAEILEEVNREPDLARECRAFKAEVETALARYAVREHPTAGRIYAFEVDGYGSVLFMDDANVPSLIAIPYFTDIPKEDPVYKATRAFVWSADNPWFFRGQAGEGIGGPHCGYGSIWPMSVILKGLTSDDPAEIEACLDQLQKTDAGTSFIHESHDKDDASRFSRTWFAWANTLFGELVLKAYESGLLSKAPAADPLDIRLARSRGIVSEAAVGRTLVSTTEGDGSHGHVLTLKKRAPGDFALEVEYSVGLPAGALVWHHDMRSSRKVRAADGRLRNASRQATVGSEWLSYWPFAVVTGEDGCGRALAIDPETPAFYHLDLDAVSRHLVLHLDVALTDESPVAEVRFVDYPIKGPSPFRQALTGYCARYPKAFASRVAEHGVWMPFSKISEVKDWEDFGFRFKEGNNESDWDKAHGIHTFLYTEPTTWWHGIKGPTNAYDLAQAAEKVKTHGDPLAKAWAAGVFHDRDGNPVGFIKDTPWCRGVVWNLNDAPGISGETTGWKVKMGHPPRCEYVDSAEMYVTVPLDFTRAHFAGMKTPLCWDARTGRPAIFKGLIGFEYVRAAAEKAHGAGCLTMANGTPMEWFWLAPHLDVLGTEWDWQDWRNGKRVWTPPSDTELIYRRALCGRKPFCFLMNTDFALFTPERARKYFDRCLAYGAFPGFFSIDAATAPYFTRPELYERDRPLYRKYLPVIKTISEAGWSPYNRLLQADDGRVISEQFGDRYVTLFNPSGHELAFKVRFAGDDVREMLTRAPVVRPREWTTVKLASESARVYEVRCE